MNEEFWDKKLKIDTIGIDESNADYHHSPYEPTSYEVLLRLLDSGYINQETVLIDYGSGKGRVGLFLSALAECRTIGIEYDEKMFCQAMLNKHTSGISNAEFIHCAAEQYEVQEADSFYFFNPFSVSILRRVLKRILVSYYECPRKMRLFFYYPTEDTLATLFGLDELICVDEIDCQDLFNCKDDSEKIVVFEMHDK